VDVALGWPLRYSHSPAEVIDTKDLDALGKSWKQSREVVMKEGQESASGATGKVYYVALTRPAKRAAMANHEKCLR